MMSTLTAHCTPELVARVRTYARKAKVSRSQAVSDLLEIALTHLDARAAGGRASHATRSPADRAAMGRRLARARWSQP